MSLGARFDAWLTTQPEEPDSPLPGDEAYPRCSDCGCFLRLVPDRQEYGEQTEFCDGHITDYYAPCDKATEHEPHTFTAHAWEVLIRRCRHCGRENEEVQA